MGGCHPLDAATSTAEGGRVKDFTIAILILAILFIGFSFTHYSKAIEECAGKGGVYVRTVHGHQCMKGEIIENE